MTIQEYNRDMDEAVRMDSKKEGSGKSWLADKGADYIADLKATATINDLQTDLVYIQKVQTVIQNQYGYRLSL